MVRYKSTKVVYLFFLIVCLGASAFAEKGYLYITSTPDSAIVIIDGLKSDRYFTPVLCTLAVGIHEIEISKKYHPTQTFKVTIQPEFVSKQTISFVQGGKGVPRSSDAMVVPSKLGQLTFITNPLGAKVIANGVESKMTTPMTLSDIPAGKHQYSIVYHYLKYDTTIEVTGDEPQTAMVDFRKFQGEDMYSIMPQVTAKVVIVVPGCEYKQDEKTGEILIKGVDAEIRIRTGDTSLALTHRELADFPVSTSTALAKDKNAAKLPKTEFTYIFEPYIDANLKFDITTYTNRKKAAPKESAQVKTFYNHFPAALNSGKAVNVRIFIENDGEIVFRYW